MRFVISDQAMADSKEGALVTKKWVLRGREESRDESIAWRHLFTLCGNNDDKSETVAIIGREHG